MTKKNYQAPKLELEEFKLDANIASNCAHVVTNGPALGEHHACDDYMNPFGANSISLFSSNLYNVNFYEDTNCDCYTSGGDGYWTS